MRYFIDQTLRVGHQLYDRGFLIDTDNGVVEWHEPIVNGSIHTFPITECSYGDGTPVSIEDGELIGVPADEYFARFSG